MTYAFKVLFKETYRLLKSGEGRDFLKLCLKISNQPRHAERTVAFRGYKFKIVDNLSFIWQAYDIYFRGVYAFKSAHSSPYIIDCGSNVGLSIKYFKDCFPDAVIEGFEPDPEVFAALHQNVAHFDGVRVHQKALWIHDNGVLFSQEHADSGYIADESSHTLKIPSASLKRILDGAKQVDLLKLDVEGAEFELMKDCAEALGKVKRIFIEVHTFSHQQQGLSSILKVLEEAGFRYFIENANHQVMPLRGNWRATDTGMDLQVNVYGLKPDVL